MEFVGSFFPAETEPPVGRVRMRRSHSSYFCLEPSQIGRRKQRGAAPVSQVVTSLHFLFVIRFQMMLTLTMLVLIVDFGFLATHN